MRGPARTLDVDFGRRPLEVDAVSAALLEVGGGLQAPRGSAPLSLALPSSSSSTAGGNPLSSHARSKNLRDTATRSGAADIAAFCAASLASAPVTVIRSASEASSSLSSLSGETVAAAAEANWSGRIADAKSFHLQRNAQCYGRNRCLLRSVRK